MFHRRLWPAASGILGVGLASRNQSECSSKKPGRFAGKTIMITGGGGTFGRAGASYFIQEGANVCLVDVNKKAVDLVVSEVKFKENATPQSPVPIIALSCDIRDTDAVAEVVRAARQRFGKIDLLWNNAGYQGEMRPILDYSSKDVQLVMDINVVGTFNVLQSVSRAMTEQGGDGYAIVQTGSVAGLRGTPTMAAYVASKAAVHGLTMTAAKDLAPSGIRVNTVMPALIGPESGFMWTRQNELHAKSGSPYFSRDPATVGRNKINGVPMKRIGTVEEVVSTVAFLMSEDSSYITGTSVVVAGGMA